MVFTEAKEGGPSVVDALDVGEKTSKEIQYVQIMERLDHIKLLGPGLERRGDKEILFRGGVRIKPDRLSPATTDCLGGANRVDIYVEYDQGLYRTVGARNGDREVLFILNKLDKTCTPMKGVRSGSLSKRVWEREAAEDIPATDALILLQKGFPQFN